MIGQVVVYMLCACLLFIACVIFQMSLTGANDKDRSTARVLGILAIVGAVIISAVAIAMADGILKL